MANDSVREHLVWLLEGGHAHTSLDAAVKGFAPEQAGLRPAGAKHSAWELLEHMRIAQHDILGFSLSADHVSPKWPEGYWPAQPGPANKADWQDAVRAFERDLAQFTDLIRDPAQDLYQRFPWGDGQTLMREALLIADHNSYHLGQLVLVRRLLGIWPK